MAGDKPLPEPMLTWFTDAYIQVGGELADGLGAKWVKIHDQNQWWTSLWPKYLSGGPTNELTGYGWRQKVNNLWNNFSTMTSLKWISYKTYLKLDNMITELSYQFDLIIVSWYVRLPRWVDRARIWGLVAPVRCAEECSLEVCFPNPLWHSI